MTVKTRDIGDHLPVTRILRHCPGISGKLKIQLKRYVKFCLCYIKEVLQTGIE